MPIIGPEAITYRSNFDPTARPVKKKKIKSPSEKNEIIKAQVATLKETKTFREVYYLS